MTLTPRRILVASDLSPSAAPATELALRLASWFGAEAHLLHARVLVCDPHLESEHRDQLQRLQTLGDEQRERVLQSAERDATIPLHTHMVRGVTAPEVIVETCSELGCDLVVVGTHGRRGISHLLLGSVAEKVVKTAPVPVLTVRPDATVPSRGVRRILVPHDFSKSSGRAVSVAASWARALGAEVSLLHAVEPVDYPELYATDLRSSGSLQRFKSRSTRALEAIRGELLGEHAGSAEAVVGRAADVAAAHAAPELTDLVVMATRGLSGLESLLLGSVAESVIRRASVPVLAIRG